MTREYLPRRRFCFSELPRLDQRPSLAQQRIDIPLRRTKSRERERKKK
jgi:hypothetical protein